MNFARAFVVSVMYPHGGRKVEEDNPQLLRGIERILDPRSESDSHLRTTLLDNNVTAKAVRNALIENGYSEDELPAEGTFYPECSGRRTQYLQRLVDFVDKTGLIIRLVYYPSYHSKYNAIERLWAGLEKSWNGFCWILKKRF